MTTSILLVVGVVMTVMFAPRVLVRLETSRVDPLCLLWLWWSTVLGSLASVGIAVAVLLAPRHPTPGPVAWLAERCREMIRLTGVHQDEVLGTVLLVALVTLTCRVLLRARRGAAASRERSTSTMQALDLVGRRDQGVLWIEHAGAVAFSVGGRANAVVATTGLRHTLTSCELEAVLEHERAHLAGRHHLHVVLADAVGTLGWFVPLFRSLPDAVRRLVELIADDEAAHSSGRSVLRAALLKIATSPTVTAPPRALFASETAVETRVRRLSHDRRRRSRPVRVVGRAIAAVGGAALPAFVAGGATVALLLACL